MLAASMAMFAEGGIPGQFSINENGKKVIFSQGNLQYNPAENIWRFAEKQYDMIGADNANISPTYNGYIDLFGWGTGNNPTLASEAAADYATFTDWGIHPISNGIQSDFTWTKTPRSPEYADKILIMMVGRLAGEKRQDLIINALQYSKYGDKIQLVFAGKGPKYKQYYKLGQKLKNPPIFTYLTKDELLNLLGQCDLYVHASDMESEAISCIEAFATGLVPVISNSRLSATKQFALDHRSLFRAGDPKDLARAIDYWLDNPEEKRRMEKIYSESAKKYSIDNSIDQFEAMLKEAIADFEKSRRS
jgi:glycosyltransferase involved in cell wall biosynthesis